MKSAFECFQRAAQCEKLAKDAKDETSRRAMLATAKYWRGLGMQAKAKEEMERPKRPAPD